MASVQQACSAYTQEDVLSSLEAAQNAGEPQDCSDGQAVCQAACGCMKRPSTQVKSPRQVRPVVSSNMAVLLSGRSTAAKAPHRVLSITIPSDCLHHYQLDVSRFSIHTAHWQQHIAWSNPSYCRDHRHTCLSLAPIRALACSTWLADQSAGPGFVSYSSASRPSNCGPGTAQSLSAKQ